MNEWQLMSPGYRIREGPDDPGLIDRSVGFKSCSNYNSKSSKVLSGEWYDLT